MIQAAEREVDLQFYVFKTDNDPANEIFDAIKRLEKNRKSAGASTPVKVRLLFSALSILGVKTEVPAKIMTKVQSLELDPKFVTFELAMYVHGGVGNLHSKTAIVDGKKALVTGANVQDQHNYKTPWHDTGYLFSGEVAAGLLSEFDHAWSRGDQWTCGTAQRSFNSCKAATKPIDRTNAPSAAIAGACVPMLVTGRPGDGWPFANGIDNTQDQAFLAAIANAKSRVRIHTPNLNDDGLKKALIAALTKNKNLELDIVLSKGFNDSAENLPTLGGTNEENSEWLYKKFAAAVPDENPCKRLHVRWFSTDGKVAVLGNVADASHAKYVSVDGQVAIVGSANMDNLAWNHSREVNVVVDSRTITAAWDAKMFSSSYDRAIPVCQ